MKKVLKYDELNSDKLLEMSNISSKISGIDNIVMWIAPNPKYHGYRIKVSNQPNRMNSDDSFTITIPDYNISGKRNTKLITNKVFKDIIKFIELNLELIVKYSEHQISTAYLLSNIKNIKNNKLYEYNNTLTEDELLEMSNITENESGIKDVVIWVGPDSKNHIFRIKVSNIPNSLRPENCFTITIPDFKVIGEVNTKLITNEVFNKIIEFINLNIDIIKKYSDCELYTEDLFDNLKKVK